MANSVPCFYTVDFFFADYRYKYTKNNIDDEEFERIKTYSTKDHAVGILKGMFIPARTDTFKHFTKNLLVPTLSHYVIDNDIWSRRYQTEPELTCVVRSLAAVVTVVFDLVTLPIRLISCAPTAIRNASIEKQAHPLYQYLAQQSGVNPSLLASDCVCVSFYGIKEEKIRKLGEKTIGFVPMSVGEQPYDDTVDDLLVSGRLPRLW